MLSIVPIFEKKNYPDRRINIAPVFDKFNPGQTQIDIAPVFEAKNNKQNTQVVSAAKLFDELNGLSCANIKWPVAPIMYEHGKFLRRVVIAMWCLGWLNFLLLGSGAIIVS